MALIDVSRYTNPRYENSSSSEVLPVGTLPTPTIRRVISGNEGIIAWDVVDGATFYDIYKNNVKITSVSRTEYRGFKPSKDLKPGESVTDTYYIQAFAKVEGNLYYSGKSNDLSFEYHRLNNPVIKYTNLLIGQVVECDEVQYGNKYDLYVGGRLYKTLDHAPTALDELGIDLTGDYYGVFEVYMIASNTTDPCLYITSEGSNKLTYTYKKLDDPIISYTPDPATIQWTAIGNADIYDVYLNGQFHESTGKPSYVFNSLPAGSYTAYVIARNSSYTTTIKYPNPKYVNSNKSNEVTFGTLANPVISLDDNLLTWPAINNAQYYIIYNYGKEIDRVSINEYRLYYTLQGQDQVYNIQVRAAADGNITDSELSNTISYVISLLDTPINVLYDVNTHILTWNSVESADYYDIVINGTVKYSTRVTSEVLALETGKNEISVIAKSYKYENQPSFPSKVIEINNPGRDKYIAKIETSKGNYEDFTVELPFSFKTTKDETLDTGSVTLLPIDRKEPFEAYTNISIFIYPENYEPEDIRDKIPFYPFPIHMLIAEDDVEEIQLGENSKFRHNISLIERTKLLETELLPNLSVTQPEDFVREIYSPKKNIVNPDSGNNKRFLSSDFFVSGYQIDTYVVHNVFTTSWLFGFKNDTLVGTLVSDYKENSKIPLPYESETSISYSNNRSQQDAFFVMTSSFAEHELKMGKRHYKYRLHSDKYDVDPNSEEIEIITTDENTQQYWDLEKMKIAPGQYYDIILEIDPVEKPADLKDGTVYYENDTKVPVNFMIDASATYAQNPIQTGSMWVGPTDVIGLQYLRPYRLVWKNIYIYEKTAEVTSEEKIRTNKLAYRVVDGIQKLLDNTKLRVYNGETWSKAKYKLDPNIYNTFKGTYDAETGLYTNALMSPELKFENGKSLFEALSVYGKLINGIPRLGIQGEQYPSNTITFDELRPKEYEQYQDDTNELEDIESSMDNHTTGFVSDLSNIVSDESWTVYPSSNGWTSPRSTSEADPYVTRDNMGIVVDQPIYRIVDVFITNFDKSEPNKIKRLTADVLENTIFQSLSNSAIGKGRAVYYKKGDNKIYGLGIIPQASEFYATLGWNSDKYVIQNILLTRGYVSTSNIMDVNEYKYKVIYVPIMDSRIYTEQSNISDLHNYTYKNFNQEDMVISDRNFGDSADVSVSRLGNNTIVKTYKKGLYIELPKIGNIKVMNGYNYYADEINYEFHNNYVEATVAYSKNWNKINPRVGIDAEYRLYEIYANDTVDRSINLNTYCYLSKNNYDITSKLLSSDCLQKMVKMFNDGKNKGHVYLKPDTAYIRTFDEDKNGFVRSQYKDYFGDNHDISAIALPVHQYNFKNSVALIAKMRDNYSAGINAVDLYNQKYAQKDVRYCDEYGRTNIVGLTLCSPTTSSLEHKMLINTGDANIKPSMSKDNIPYNRAIPSVKYYNNTDVPSKIGNIVLNSLIQVNKDNREALAFVYQLHFQTFDKDITIHKGLTEKLWNRDNSSIAAIAKEYEEYDSPRYYIYIGDGSKTTNITNFADVKQFSIPTITKDGTRIKIGKTKSIGNIDNSEYDGYCLAWPNGDIIYSVREKLTNNAYFEIPDMYLNFSDDKIDYRNN